MSHAHGGGEREFRPVRIAILTVSDSRDESTDKSGRLEFQRGVLTREADGSYTVHGVSHQGAGVLRSMSEANCFIVLPLEQETVHPGAEVEVQPFAGLV